MACGVLQLTVCTERHQHQQGASFVQSQSSSAGLLTSVLSLASGEWSAAYHQSHLQTGAKTTAVFATLMVGVGAWTCLTFSRRCMNFQNWYTHTWNLPQYVKVSESLSYDQPHAVNLQRGTHWFQHVLFSILNSVRSFSWPTIYFFPRTWSSLPKLKISLPQGAIQGHFPKPLYQLT